MTIDTIRAHNRSIKHVGDWTTARKFDVRASRSSIVLDLLLPELEQGEIEINVDLDHSMLKLLVPDGTVIDEGELRMRGGPRRSSWFETEARAFAPGGEIR